MVTLNLLILICLSYVVFLFCVAFAADRAAKRGRVKWLNTPLVYTLSLSIYCTAWTFYGAVGFAARSGLEYLTIYLGPTLVMIGWWWALRKMVRVGRSQRITSIADLISSRYGKSTGLAVFVTVFAVIGTTPYIALQLQSVTLSFAAFTQVDAATPLSRQGTALWVAAGLVLFTILFGTRNLDANERHHGVVMAIALEAVVKLFALLAVGVFVVWGLSGGIEGIVARIDGSHIAEWQVSGRRCAGRSRSAATAGGGRSRDCWPPPEPARAAGACAWSNAVARSTVVAIRRSGSRRTGDSAGMEGLLPARTALGVRSGLRSAAIRRIGGGNRVVSWALEGGPGRRGGAGGSCRTRTYNLGLKRPLLYQLS